MLVVHPDDSLSVLDSLQEYIEDEIPHYLVSGLVSVVTRNPLVGIWLHAVIHTGFFPWYWDILTDGSDSDSRGGGGPSAQSQPPPSSSKFSRQARASAQGGKSGAPARASTQGSRHRRKSCPKGHYWSYTYKKCVKSKF